jgi:hypothetical protein
MRRVAPGDGGIGQAEDPASEDHPAEQLPPRHRGKDHQARGQDAAELDDAGGEKYPQCPAPVLREHAAGDGSCHEQQTDHGGGSGARERVEVVPWREGLGEWRHGIAA